MQNIVNLTPRIQLIRFNSGIEIILGPHEKREVMDSEIRDNRIIKKLNEEKTITIFEQEKHESGSVIAKKTTARDKADSEKSDTK